MRTRQAWRRVARLNLACRRWRVDESGSFSRFSLDTQACAGPAAGAFFSQRRAWKNLARTTGRNAGSLLAVTTLGPDWSIRETGNGYC